MKSIDFEAVSTAARQETRNREVYLPPISVYRWWARRTGSVFGAIIDAYAANRRERLLICDPFAGGGVIPIAAIVRGHRVYAQDLNPWAALGLAAALALPDKETLADAVEKLATLSSNIVAEAYGTRFRDGTPATVAHTFRVATSRCSVCGHEQRMFPHAVVSLLARKERGQPEAFLACPKGHLFRGRSDKKSACPDCGVLTNPGSVYTPRRTVVCAECQQQETLAQRSGGSGWNWEIVLVERVAQRQREIDVPTLGEVAQAESDEWKPQRELGPIPPGQETGVLIRHGFREWEDLYPKRQRFLMERFLEIARTVSDDRTVQDTLRMAILGASEMAGYLSRWDRWYLKSYESMAGHRFNLTTFTAEPNVWGTAASGRGTVSRRLRTFVRITDWLSGRTERSLRVRKCRTGNADVAMRDSVDACIVEGSSEQMLLSSNSVDLVLTDPPYHDDVQYDELSMPLRAWADLTTERLKGEAVVNRANGMNTADGGYRDLLTRIFVEAQRTLKSDGHVILTYANREAEAWVDILGALHDAGLRAVGYGVVHSENETDSAKRNVRACTRDLIMDLVPANNTTIKQWAPKLTRDDEGEFLAVVGQTFLNVGAFEEGWERRFKQELKKCAFVRG